MPKPDPQTTNDCPRCGGCGFETPGTGYGDVCSECGGQSASAVQATRLEHSIEVVRQELRHSTRGQDAMDNVVFSLKVYRDSCKEWDRGNRKWKDEGL